MAELRYRDALSLWVRDIVRHPDREPSYFTDDILDSFGVAVTDREAFMSLAKSTLTDLHDGVIARYGLRPGEFHAWRAAWRTS